MLRKMTGQNLHKEMSFGLVLLFLFAIWLRLEANPLFINHDVAMYVDIGHRILDGQRPYVDYDEINLHTIHYLNVLPALLTRGLDINPISAFRLLMFAGLLYMIVVSKWLTRDLFASPFVVNLALAALLYHSFNLVISDFGQREHIFVILVLPWFWLRLRHTLGLAEHRGVALSVGFIAAIAFSIKPYFVLALLFSEAYLLLAHHRRALKVYVWKAEWLGFVAFCLLYVGYFILNLDVLQALLSSLRFTSEGYVSYGSTPFSELVFSSIATWFVIIWAIVTLFYQEKDSLTMAFISFALASLGLLLAYALQSKGFSYHSIPYGFFILIAMIGAAGRWVEVQLTINRLTTPFLLSLSLSAGLYIGLQIGQSNQDLGVQTSEPLRDILSQISAPDDQMLMYSGFPHYSATVSLELWQGSFYALSHVVSFAAFKYGSEQALQEPEVQRYLQRVRQELAEGYPVVILQTGLLELFHTQGLMSDLIIPRYKLHGNFGDTWVYAYVGEPPTSPSLFNWNDELLLLGVSLPEPSQYQACQTVPIKSWWELQAERPLRAQQTDYYVSFILQQQGQVLVKQEAQLLRVSEADGQQVYAYQLDLSIPCDASAGDYDLVMALAAVVPAEEDHTPRPVEALGLGAYPYLRSVSISTP